MFKKGADGVTKQGKTKGKNLGDSGPSVGIQHGGKGKGAKTVTNESLKAMGRNMARVANQGMMRKSAGRGR
jgi:hypothetical protein